MGLIFPLQNVPRKSNDEYLLVKSTSKRFTMGGSLLVIGALILTMYIAAEPLLDKMFLEGAWIDVVLSSFVYLIILSFPFFTIFCFFYQEVLEIRKNSSGKLDVSYFKKFGPFKWKKESLNEVSWEDFHIGNWKSAPNIAALKEEERKVQERYANRGHWILYLKSKEKRVPLERRAKKEDVDWLWAQINFHFDQDLTLKEE